jgi:methylmalonyl-CoA mutase N-terminal domain/subunit
MDENDSSLNETESLIKRLKKTSAEDRLIKGDKKTQSGIDVKVFYGPDDIKHISYEERINDPGRYPYVRGTYPQMYRERLWVSGIPAFGGIRPYLEELGMNEEDYFNFLVSKELLTCASRTSGDYHQLATIDPDHPLTKHDITGCGGPLWSIYQILSDTGTRHGTAELIKASVDHGFVLEFGHQAGPPDVCEFTMYLAVCEELGLDWRQLRGNMVNDPLTSHITGCMLYKQPLEVGFRVSTDAMEFVYRNMPKWRPTNGGCAYDLREAGLDSFQELAFRYGIFIEYADEMIRRGLNFKDFGHKPAIALSGEIDFFETICKLRACRLMFSQIAVERYGLKPDEVICPPVNTNCAGNAMTHSQQIFNIIRQTIMSMASVLGGVNGMEMKSYTEAVSAPPIEAWMVDRGIEKIIAEEANIPLVADPLGGSYYVEWLTDHIKEKSMEIVDDILDRGGMLECIRSGWIQREVEKATLERARELEEHRKIKVGENEYQELTEPNIELPQLTLGRAKIGQKPNVQKHLKEWEAFKSSRTTDKPAQALNELYKATKNGENVIPYMIKCWRAMATVGEIMGVIRVGTGFAYDQFNMVEMPSWIEKALA